MFTFEEKEFLLVESRGFAGAPWKKEIDKIISWIRDEVKYIYLTQQLNKIEFNVPQDLCDQISFLTNLQIKCIGVHVDDLKKLNRSLGGDVGEYKPVKIIQQNNTNVLDGIIINLCFPFKSDGNIIQRYIYGSFIHEINHAYDIYMNMVKNGNYNRFNNSAFKYTKFNDNTYIQLIIYRLFSETEFNALVASVYGDLKEMNSVRENYSVDILDTQAYKIYNNIKSNYINYVDNLNIDDCKKIYQHFKTYNIKLKCGKNVNIKTFKHVLKYKINHCLKRLLHNIGKVASYYYDENEINLNEGLAMHFDPIDFDYDLL